LLIWRHRSFGEDKGDRVHAIELLELRLDLCTPASFEPIAAIDQRAVAVEDDGIDKTVGLDVRGEFIEFLSWGTFLRWDEYSYALLDD
jgi:hypothetical protein